MTVPPDWLSNIPAVQNESHFGDRNVHCFVERPRSLYALFASAVECNGRGEALVSPDGRFTWAELEAQVAVIAAGLRSQGVGCTDRVLLLMSNRAEFVIAFFALVRLGAIAVPVSSRSSLPEVSYVAQQCGAIAVLSEAEFLPLVPDLVEAPMLRLRVALELDTRADWLSWDALREGHLSTERHCVVAVQEEDTAVILYTSGTTGRPKGAELTHLGIVHSTMHYASCMALGALDRSLVAVPLSHVTGLIAQLCTMALVHGTVILMGGFKAATFLPKASSERMTHTVMVPTMYQLCLMQSDVAAHDLSHWRIGAYGGAPMVPATIAAIAKTWSGLRLMNAYGATETTSPATIMPPSDTAKRPDSVGRAVPCAELQVVDSNGQPLPSGAIGEIWIRGPMVVKAYWNDPAATAQAISNGFWRSGDIGRIDSEGYVQVLDRIKDVIIRGGYKVYSSEVEAVLLEHPAVVEAAIIGMPCDILGERVCAFVCLRALVNEKALFDWCKERLSDYKVPEQWRMGTDPLPRNANGKLMKKTLRQTL